MLNSKKVTLGKLDAFPDFKLWKIMQSALQIRTIVKIIIMLRGNKI